MRTAIITGASTGVGLEFCKQIKDVFPEITEYWVIARRMDRLQAISIPGILIKPLALDLTDPDSIKKMAKLIDMLEENDDVQNVWHNWKNEDDAE